MQQGGGVLHAYGVNLKDSVALVTTANEPLQDPKKVGNGLKSIAINFAGMSASAKDGTLKLNKTAMALQGIAGIDIYSNKKTGQIKSMVNLLEELHPKWNKLRDDQKMALSEAIAGKHRANVFQALMQNWTTFEKMKSQFNNGEHFGSAEKENTRFVNSIGGKINRLKETMTSLASILVNNKGVYSFFDALNAGATGLERLVKFADKHNSQIPLMVAGLVGLKSAYKNFSDQIIDWSEIDGQSTKKKQGLFDKLLSGDKSKTKKKELKESSVNAKEAKVKKESSSAVGGEVTFSDEKKKVDDAKESRKEYNKESEKTHENHKLEIDDLDNSSTKRKKDNQVLKETTDGHKQLGKTVAENTNKIKEQHKETEAKSRFNFGSDIFAKGTAKVKDFSTKVGGIAKGLASGLLSSAVSMGTSAIVMLGATKLIEGAYALYNRGTNGIEMNKEEHLKTRDALKQENSEIKTNIDYVKKNADAIDSLARRKREILNTPEDKRSTDQLQELQRIRDMENKLAKISPQSVVGYDKNGDPIIKATANAKEYLKMLELIKKQKSQALNDANSNVYNDNTQKTLYGNIIGESLADRIKRQRSELKTNLMSKPNQIASILGISLNRNTSLHGTDGETITYMDKYNHMLDKLAGAKNIEKASAKFRVSMGRWKSEVDEGFKELRNTVAKYDQINTENTSIQLENLSNNTRFTKMSKGSQESALGLASTFQWGRIENPKYATDALLNLTEKISPAKISSITKEINDLNQAYHLDRDYETYSKGIDSIAQSIGKLSGMTSKGDIAKITGYIKDIDRGFDNIDDAWEAKYMKNHGTKKSDVLKNDASGIYAQKVREQYGAIKDAHEDFQNAKNFDERKQSVERFANNPAISKGQREFAKALLSSHNLTDKSLSAFEKITRGLMHIDMSSKNAKEGINSFAEALDEGNLSKANKFSEMLGLSADEVSTLMSNGLKGNNIRHMTDDVSKQLYKNVEDFYNNFKNSKGEKIEVPIEVQAKVAENGLTDNDIRGMEHTIESWGMRGSKADDFRVNASKYFEGTGGDTQKAFQAMAKTNEGLKTAIDFGIEKQLTPYNDKVKSLADGFHNLTEAMQGSAKAMSGDDYVKYIDSFNSLDENLKGVAKKYNVSSATELTDINNTAKTITNTGFDIGTATKTVDLIINTVGVDNLGSVNDALSNIPSEIRTMIITEFGTQNGGDAIHGLKNLITEAHGDSNVINAVIKAHLEKNEGVDFLEKYSKSDAESDVKEITIKIKADSTDAENKKNKLKENSKSTHNVNGNTSDAESKKDKLKKNSNSTHNVKGDTSDADGKKNQLKQNSNSIHTIKVKLSKIPDMAKGMFGKVKSTVLSVTDNASALAIKATGAVKAFPTQEKKAIVTTKDNASALAKKATGAVNAFPTGVKTCIMRTVYQTIGSPPSGGGSGGKKSPKSLFIDEETSHYKDLRLEALKEHKLPTLEMGMIKPRHTQMNPLAGTTVDGGASVHGGAGVSTGGVTTVSGGSASSETFVEKIYRYSNIEEAIDAFRHITRKLTYKGLTTLNKLKFSAKEVGDAFKYDVDVLRDMDFAIKRIDNSVKSLDLRASRATGSTKASLLNLENDQLREKIRRLKVKEDQLERNKLYRRANVIKYGIQLTPGNEIPSNSVEIITKLKKELEDLDKKNKNAANTKGKSKGKGGKTSVEDRKKEIEKQIKEIDQYQKDSLAKQEAFSAGLEAKNKIAENEDIIRKDKITGWIEYYDSVEKIIDISTKKISRDLDIISLKSKNAFGLDKLSLLNQQVGQYSEMQKQLSSTKSTYEHMAETIKQNLIRDFGFKFNGDDIVDYENKLATLRDSSTLYNEAKNLANRYLDITKTKIKDVEKEQIEFNEKVRESMITRLNDTKAVEDKITNIYKKQLEEQIKGLEKVQKLRDEDVRKRKEAYQLARKEADFQDELNKKKEELKELELKRDILSKDFSQRGQKDKQKVEKQIKSKSEEITKLTNRYFDDLIIRGFDEESKQGSDRIRDAREQMEEKYSDVELLKMAQESLKSGVLIGINGEKNQNLQEALTKYINRYEGGLGATGSILKGQALGNLEVATDTINQFSNVISQIGSDKYNVGGYIQESQYNQIETDKKKYNNEINYNSPLVSIQGVKADDIAKEIYPFIKGIMDEQLKALTGNVR